jgi:hypothetical protein
MIRSILSFHFIILSLLILNSQNAPICSITTVSTTNNSAVASITVENFSNISASNLKIHYDPAKASLTNVTLGAGVSPSGGLSFNNSVPGEVLIGWYGAPVLSLADGSIFLNLYFNRTAFGATLISFIDDNQSNSCIFYDQNYNVLNDQPTSSFYNDGFLSFNPLNPAPVTMIGVVEACIGETVVFPVKVTGFSNVGAASFIIQYDHTVLSNPSFVNTSGVMPLMAYFPQPGIITVAGQSQVSGGHSLPDNSAFFTISFTFQGGNTDISFDHTYNTNCQYGGPTPFFEPKYDMPKEDYFLNGEMKCETEKPIISTTATSGELGNNPIVYPPGFSGLDNCDMQFIPVVTTLGPVNSGCEFMQTWYANYTDACGNHADEISITYNWIEDTEPPVFQNCPVYVMELGENPLLFPDELLAINDAGTVTDNCGIQSLTAIGGIITGSNLKTQTWVVSAIDFCGNSSECIVMYSWSEPKIVSLTLFIESLYDGNSTMRKSQDVDLVTWDYVDRFSGDTADLVTIELWSDLGNHILTEQAELSTSGVVSLEIDGTLNGDYYIYVRHRNSIAVSSAVPVSFSGSVISYDFSVSAASAFLDNQKELGSGVYGLYGGDVDQDGSVGAFDLIMIDNAARTFTEGYVPEDVNGDGEVGVFDMVIVDNNTRSFVFEYLPF